MSDGLNIRNNLVILKRETMNEELIGKKVLDVKDWGILFDDGTQAHIDFMVYK